MTLTYPSTSTRTYNFHTSMTASATPSWCITPVVISEFLCDVFFEDGDGWLNIWLTQFLIDEYRKVGKTVLVNPRHPHPRITAYDFSGTGIVITQ